jgi:hypothetical protein
MNVSMKIHFNDIHVCVRALVKNVEERKIYFTFMHEINNDFLHASDGLWNRHLLFKYFLVDT